jgi:hypothetical protein
MKLNHRKKYNKYKYSKMRKKILQSIANTIIKMIENSMKDDMAFNYYMAMGLYLDDYAKSKEIYLD